MCFRTTSAERFCKGGNHGWDPEYKSMHVRYSVYYLSVVCLNIIIIISYEFVNIFEKFCGLYFNMK